MIPSAETIVKLRKLQQYILEEPKRFNLTFWGAHVDPKYQDKTVEELRDLLVFELSRSVIKDIKDASPPCGTVACLAGNVCVMEGIIKPVDDMHQDAYVFSEETPSLACKALGIDEQEGEKLFYLHDWTDHGGWPQEFEFRLEAATPGTQKYAQVAVDRIEHYIQTGE